MKRKLLLTLLILLAVMLTAVGCQSEHTHEGGAATCTDAAVCTSCGESYGNPLGHDWATKPSFDSVRHWYACSRCDEELDSAPHTGGAPTTNNKAACSVCGESYGELLASTEPIYPVAGTEVTLSNARITGWFRDYDFTSTDTDAHWLESDVFAPVPVTFSWRAGEDALYYKLYISTNADMTDPETYLVSECSLAVDYLYTGTHYWWVVDAIYDGYTVRSEVFDFTTAPSPRTVYIDGVSNSRDIGGYITADGNYRIKQGMIYRSAKLDDITELGKLTLLHILGVKTDLDLRGPDKGTQPVTELNYENTACPWYSTGENAIWASETTKTEFANTIKVFADPDNYPIIFHCALGRDRTGTLALVLEGLLGLDVNTLIMEYELSVFSYWGSYGSSKFNNSLRKQIVDTYNYIDDNYEGDTFSEKVEDFLLEIGVTQKEIDSIRSIMLEEV